MQNFLKDTIKALEFNKLNPDDIIFIGSQRSGHSCTWEEFQVLADREYSEFGFENNGVAGDLVIAFKDGGVLKLYDFERGNGLEWNYISPFIMPAVIKPIKTLIGGYHESLASMQPQQPDSFEETIKDLLTKSNN